MKKKDLKFAEWVAKKITFEELEYDFSDEIWFYENDSNQIRQFNTEGLYQVYLLDIKR